MRFRFNPELDHIIIRAILSGSVSYNARAVLDTGANTIIIVPSLAEFLELKLLGKQSNIFSLEQKYVAKKALIPRLTALGYEFKNLEAVVFGLSEHLGAELLIGLKFLRKFSDLHISFKKSYLELTR